MLLADARAWPLADGCAQLVATDPPYNAQVPYEGYVDNVPWSDYWAMLEKMAREAYRVLCPGGMLAVMMPHYRFDVERTRVRARRYRVLGYEHRRLGPAIRMAGRFEQVVEEAGFLYEGTLCIGHSMDGVDVTALGTGIGGSSRPNFRTTSRSLILAFKERSAVPRRNGKWGELPLDWCKTTWLIRPAWHTGKGHPCPWPREVAARLIQLYSNPGDLVVDPFNGSGVTVAAAVKLERRGVGLDISRAYCQIALDRLLQGTMALGV